MNAKIPVFVICVEAIIYFLIYTFHDCTFEILFQTGDFCPLRCFFSKYVQLKTSFSDEKSSPVDFEAHFDKEAIGNYRDKVLNENSIVGRSWSSANLFIMQNYNDNANRNISLAVEICDSFSFFEFKVPYVLLVKKES